MGRTGSAGPAEYGTCSAHRGGKSCVGRTDCRSTANHGKAPPSRSRTSPFQSRGSLAAISPSGGPCQIYGWLAEGGTSGMMITHFEFLSHVGSWHDAAILLPGRGVRFCGRKRHTLAEGLRVEVDPQRNSGRMACSVFSEGTVGTAR